MNGGGPWDVSSRILAGKWLGPTYAPGWSVGQERWARSGSVVQIPSISPPLAHGGRNPLTALRDSGRIAAGGGRPCWVGLDPSISTVMEKVRMARAPWPRGLTVGSYHAAPLHTP